MPQPPLDPEDRARRREEADAHLQQRRRVAAVAALAAVFAIAVAVVALGGGSDDGGGSETTVTTGRSPAKAEAKAKAPTGGRTAEPAPADSAPPDGPIPILMYHVVEAPQAGTAFPELWLPAERFEAQVAMLEREGYNAITMRDAWEYWQEKRRIPKRPSS